MDPCAPDCVNRSTQLGTILFGGGGGWENIKKKARSTYTDVGVQVGTEL
jgi:hypothetical protein